MHILERRNWLGWASVGACALSLAACGGGGSAASGAGSPATGGTGAGGPTATDRAASFNRISIPAPAGTIGPDYIQTYATNDGLYLLMRGDLTRKDVILKRTVGRGGAAGWLSRQMDGTGTVFAPVSLAPEGADAFAAYWAVDAGGKGYQYGVANMNNGGIQTANKDDLYIDRLVSSAVGETNPIQWVINYRSEVWAHYIAGSASSNAQSYFRPIVQSGLNGSGLFGTFGAYAAVSDATGWLYAGAGTMLRGVSITRDVKTWDLSVFGNGVVHTLVMNNGNLWIGYADKILVLKGDTIRTFASTGKAGMAVNPQFCIANNNLYAANGSVYEGINVSTTAGTPRGFLRSGSSLSATDANAYNQLSAAMETTGIYCADGSGGGYGPYVYTVALPALGAFDLLQINPL